MSVLRAQFWHVAYSYEDLPILGIHGRFLAGAGCMWALQTGCRKGLEVAALWEESRGEDFTV